MNPFRPAGRNEAQRTPIRAEVPSAKTSGTTATLRLYDPIDSWGEYWGVSAKEFARVLDELPDTVTEIRLLINSPGGEVFEGIAIMNALRAHRARVVAVVEGIAASSASFIAAAADELVMMQNSQLYIHNAWAVVIGDAADLIEVASELSNSFDRNIASVYAAKSGDSVDHWMAEMEKDRFLTADEAVAEKLADRIEGVGDAEAAKAKFDLSVFARAEGRRAAAHNSSTPELPSSSEPGEPHQKEELQMSDTIKAGLRERLGVTDAEASDETLLAALDEALTEQAESPTVSAPEGTQLIDTAVLASLQSDAAAGREARAQQDGERRDRVITAALNDGRIAPASQALFRAQLDKDEEGTTALLNSLPKNKVPVAEIGKSDLPGDTDDDSKLLAAAGWGTDEKGA